MADENIDVSFPILCLNCDNRFTYYPIVSGDRTGVTVHETHFDGVPCPFCDMVWEIYSRVKTMEPFEIENILIKPRI